MARSERMQNFVNPILDVMQTMPSFVYLIPVVMLLGIGRVPGVIAVVIYAIPPMIRLTNLGIRMVDKAGKISTFAGKCGQPGFDGDGGDATAALLDRPYGIVFDASDNLYIADTHNHLIRVVYK